MKEKKHPSFGPSIKLLGDIPIIRSIFYKKNGQIRNKYKRFVDAKPKNEVGSPASPLAPRVLIVAETTIPQCYRYRVQQKKDVLNILGVETNIVSWTKKNSVISFINTHTHVIFYRVPYNEYIEDAIELARSLGNKIYYDIDDLIFDVDNYSNYLNNQVNLSNYEKIDLLKGSESYHKMMSHADALIGSTSALCRRMAEIFQKRVIQIDNAISEIIPGEPDAKTDLGPEDHVRIIYGSGTRTHDEDLKLIENALLNVLERFPKSILILVGPLSIPSGLEKISNRIKKLPMMGYNEYIGVIKKCDISLAPLVSNCFNNCKSAIKLFESASCGVPTVASATQSFMDAKKLGVPVLLAETESDWEQSLCMLLNDADLRRQMGKTAMSSLADTFSYESIAERQYANFLSDEKIFPDSSANKKSGIMIVNLFWKPLSFGGATLVAENLVGELKEIGEFEISVCTGDSPDEYGIGVRRAKIDGIDVFRILSHMHGTSEWSNRASAAYFKDVLSFARPNLVHFHCIQGMGVELMAACSELNIPYVVTAHDAWWLCARQFLIRENGVFCNQDRIDARVCFGCVDSPELLDDRNKMLKAALIKSEAIIAPSRYWRKFYLKNGFDDDQVIHIENGIREPKTASAEISPRRRFGFVGGMEAVKGYHNIKRAFSDIETALWELYIVDASTKFGGEKFAAPRFGHGLITVLSGYAQEEIDSVFEKFDVLLFPSLWPESFGLAVREALARGKWVITSNTGGQCEPIVDGVNGRLIPLNDDGTALRAAIEEAIAGINVLQSYRNEFQIMTIQKNAQLTNDLYRKIVDRNLSMKVR